MLRNIDKAGGLDNYILNTREKHLASDKATALRMEMLAHMRQKTEEGIKFE